MSYDLMISKDGLVWNWVCSTADYTRLLDLLDQYGPLYKEAKIVDDNGCIIERRKREKSKF